MRFARCLTFNVAAASTAASGFAVAGVGGGAVELGATGNVDGTIDGVGGSAGAGDAGSAGGIGGCVVIKTPVCKVNHLQIPAKDQKVCPLSVTRIWRSFS